MMMITQSTRNDINKQYCFLNFDVSISEPHEQFKLVYCSPEKNYSISCFSKFPQVAVDTGVNKMLFTTINIHLFKPSP